MELELGRRLDESDNARLDAHARACMKRKQLWGASYMMRNENAPRVCDDDVEILAELAYLSTLPAFRYITLVEYATTLQTMSDDHKALFAFIVNAARCLDTYGKSYIATDRDWKLWLDAV